jgi:hypothetical protein
LWFWRVGFQNYLAFQTAYFGAAAFLLATMFLIKGFVPRRTDFDPHERHPSRFKPHELAVAAGFCLLAPLVALGPSLGSPDPGVVRYALPAILGVTIVLVHGLSLLIPKRNCSVLALALTVTFPWFAVVAVDRFNISDGLSQLVFQSPVLDRLNEIPIVVDHKDFLTMKYYAREDVADRLAYVYTDQSQAAGYIKLLGFRDLGMHQYEQFVRENKGFFLLTQPFFSSSPLGKRLKRDNAQLKLMDQMRDQWLFHVSIDPNASRISSSIGSFDRALSR